MLRMLNDGAVTMCREVWRAAGKVWALVAKEQREEERVVERQRRRYQEARRTAIKRSLEKRRTQAQRGRCWLMKEQRLAALDAADHGNG